MRRLHDVTWKNLYWPDYASAWWRSARDAARGVLKRSSVDAVFTVAVPFSSHLAYRDLHREFPNVRWIADNGDPFSFETGAPPNNLRIYAKRNERAESEILAECDAFSVTTESTRLEYARRFSESAQKLVVIGPLLSVPESTKQGPPFFPNDGVLRLLYVGTLYRKLRSPRYLLELVAAARAALPHMTLELHLMGALRDCSDLVADFAGRIGNSLIVHGLVDRDTVATAMQSANVLVNIGNTNAHQLPSKVVDYAATGRPVINISKSPTDSSREFFSNYPACLHIVDTGERPTEDSVHRFTQYLQHLPPIVNAAARNKVLAPYTADAITSAYERLAFPTTASHNSAIARAEKQP